MIKISEKQLKQLNACESGINWFKKQKVRSLKPLITKLLKTNHFDWAKWLLCQLLTNEQNILWAIGSAKSVLDIFEKNRPNDNRPRLAIQAAKDFLAGKATREEVLNAANAANAASAAAYYAANAASAAWATSSAAYYAARLKKQIEVGNIALKLLGEIK